MSKKAKRESKVTYQLSGWDPLIKRIIEVKRDLKYYKNPGLYVRESEQFTIQWGGRVCGQEHITDKFYYGSRDFSVRIDGCNYCVTIGNHDYNNDPEVMRKALHKILRSMVKSVEKQKESLTSYQLTRIEFLK